ncbi:MAG: 4-hydroxy-3-methylbut-2-enyl diphosphate reductase [Gammaproteobacteria bacterium]|nr:4-hydroxy-3-methylbut-2-enyl diphosphate reductase [Gammaproteobacteria bacterium]MBU6509111.1 4-hydroxy-3-methylbut-2-enyl diphosphate reductase [Gammaproteobacteria bacterium]MDE1984424.1 4-hydroxy-3-methylbut-2-enyl diphosphate reductase [Gammaproteobacteria bacterium]MDE2108564.1 4-hydroxy-3-methylbut-2-enyl diphosphate reductase [Gammaproteobacteria bacterium]MDE2460789.1 4-hydroxy-3-methylbut-2-enyl diphosphate reductase [Gammaproteobacteria bacterium]
MQVILAQPRGFCAGVTRAIDVVEQALQIFGPPVYVLHEIVHNQHVVNDLRAKGAVFTESLAKIPAGAVTIFSAHGVSDQRVKEARERGLKVIDATCPLVAKVHVQAQKYEHDGYELIIVGHPGHPEVEGTRGRIRGPVHVISEPEEVAALQVRDPEKVAYVTQTTLSVDDTVRVIAALKQRFPGIRGPETKDICYATQNRQNAVRELAKGADVIVVVGARNSSNTNRLREVGEQAGVRSYLVQDANELQRAWFKPEDRVGVTAGASTPEALVSAVLAKLGEWGNAEVHKLAGPEEHVKFMPPPELSASAAKARG